MRFPNAHSCSSQRTRIFILIELDVTKTQKSFSLRQNGKKSIIQSARSHSVKNNFAVVADENCWNIKCYDTGCVYDHEIDFFFFGCLFMTINERRNENKYFLLSFVSLKNKLIIALSNSFTNWNLFWKQDKKL